jgi:hypothetical protein
MTSILPNVRSTKMETLDALASGRCDVIITRSFRRLRILAGKSGSATSYRISKASCDYCRLFGLCSTMSPSPSENFPERSEREEDSGSDDGVDEEGMAKLMQALGDDGLDDLAIAHLAALAGSDGGGQLLESGDDDDDDDGQSDDMGSVGVEELEAESASEEQDSERAETEPGDEAGVAFEDVESVDEDAVPRQRLEIDNKVSSSFAFAPYAHHHNRPLWSEYEAPFS